MMEDIKNIIESLLFVSETPLTMDRIKSVLEINDSRTIRDALDRLSQDYETRKGAFYLRSVAGGYQICTRPEYGQWIKRLLAGLQDVRLGHLHPLLLEGFQFGLEGRIFGIGPA